MKVAQNTEADGSRAEAALHPVPVGVGIQIFDFSKHKLCPTQIVTKMSTLHRKNKVFTKWKKINMQV